MMCRLRQDSARFRRTGCVVLLLLCAGLWTLTACLPPALPRVIKIGLVAPFEGRYRYVGYDAIYAARLAVREINAAGGAGGWSLELAAYDDRAAAELARTTAHNLVTDPDVVAVIGHYRQSSTDAAGAVYAAAAMPLLVVGAWLTPTHAPVWHMAPSPERAAAAMLAAADLPSLTSPLAGGTEGGQVWGTGPLAAALETALPVSGLAPIFSVLAPLEAAVRLSEARAGGWGGPFIGGWDVAAPDFATVAGAASEGALFVTPYPWARDLPGLEAWETAYRSAGPHVPDPGIYALPTYDAIYALAEAIAAAVEAGGRPTRAGVAAALPGVRRDGVLGTLSWDAAGYGQALPLYVYVWEQAGARVVGMVDGRR
jgi:branched-chain amino acid transport system substrate-binding protein